MPGVKPIIPEDLCIDTEFNHEEDESSQGTSPSTVELMSSDYQDFGLSAPSSTTSRTRSRRMSLSDVSRQARLLMGK